MRAALLLLHTYKRICYVNSSTALILAFITSGDSAEMSSPSDIISYAQLSASISTMRIVLTRHRKRSKLNSPRIHYEMRYEVRPAEAKLW